MSRFTRFSRGKIWFVDIGTCKRFDIFQLWPFLLSLSMTIKICHCLLLSLPIAIPTVPCHQIQNIHKFKQDFPTDDSSLLDCQIAWWQSCQLIGFLPVSFFSLFLCFCPSCSCRLSVVKTSTRQLSAFPLQVSALPAAADRLALTAFRQFSAQLWTEGYCPEISIEGKPYRSGFTISWVLSSNLLVC